jgi:nucleoside-diphosphate-sugar epimerase
MTLPVTDYRIEALRGRSVLVTGATGFLGANLTRRVLAAGATVHAIVRDTSSLWRLGPVAHLVEIHRGNLLNSPVVQRIVKASRPELIYHLAVERPGSVPGDHNRVLDANAQATLSLLQATSELAYRRMVVAGSSLEYGHGQMPLVETMAIRPGTQYGASKAAASQAALEFAREHQRPIVVLRPFSIFGYYESPARLIPTAIVAALDGTRMRLTQPGLRRDFVFVEDVVDAFIAAATTDGLAPGETLNVGTGIQTTNERAVAAVEEACGRKIDIAPQRHANHETDTTHWVADITNVRNRLGWQARHSFEEGIEKTTRWIQQHRQDYPPVGVAAQRSEVAGAA